MAEFYGQSGMVILPPVRRYDPLRGEIIVLRYRGIPTTALLEYLILRAQGKNCELTPAESGGYSILSVTTGVEDTADKNVPLADLWSLPGNQLEISLWNMPEVLLVTNKFPDAFGLSRWKRDVEALLNGETEITYSDGTKATLTVASILAAVSVAAPVGPGGTPADVATIRALLKSLATGVTSKPLGQYVLKHSLVFPVGTSVQAAYLNVDRIYTTAQLVSAESVPVATLPFKLPPTGYWLKLPPSVEQQSTDRWMINQEWWHSDFYDPFVHKPAV